MGGKVTDNEIFISRFFKVNYDIKKNGKLETVTNIMLRFKITQAIQSRKVVYYDYTVQEKRIMISLLTNTMRIQH